MKTINLTLLTIGIGAVCFLTSCSTPSPYLFTASTNDVPTIVAKTNWVTVTNIVEKVQGNTNTVTEPNGQVTTTITWLPVHEVHLDRIAQVEFSTNYAVTYTVSTNAQSLAAIAGTISNVVAPGSGGLVTTGLTAALGIVATWFTRRQTKRKGELVAGTLAQSVETLREVLKSSPTTASLDDKIVAFLQKNQTSVGVIQDVANLVESTVDNEAAKAAARAILQITK